MLNTRMPRSFTDTLVYEGAGAEALYGDTSFPNNFARSLVDVPDITVDPDYHSTIFHNYDENVDNNDRMELATSFDGKPNPTHLR